MAREVSKVPGSAFWSGDFPKLRRALKVKRRGGKLATGLKLQYVPGTMSSVETPYFINVRKRRRRRNKLAKLARRRNR